MPAAYIPLGEAARLSGRSPQALKAMADADEVFAAFISGHYWFDPERLPERPPLPEGAPGELPELMTAQEVARLFRVHPKTVSTWARQGVLPYIRTLGGHRRYAAEHVRRLLSEQQIHDPREDHTPDTRKDDEP